MTTEKRYDIILERLMKSLNNRDSVIDIEKRAKKMSHLSSRHHYLPQYYVEGFCGSDHKLAVYDKKDDTIHSIRKSPKSVFFEKDRHSFEIDGLKFSMLEDELFSATDSRLAPYLVRLRDDVNTSELITNDIQTNMSVFLIDLFWRNPKLDKAAVELFERSQIRWNDKVTGETFHDSEREKAYKEDKVYRIIERFKIHIESMRHINDIHLPGSTYSKLWDFKKSIFVLGDFPLIFSKTPTCHTDLATYDHFFPISSSRIYGCNQLEGMNLKSNDSYIVNALQIDQAIHSVVASDESILKESVNFYKKVYKDGSLQLLKKYLFAKL